MASSKASDLGLVSWDWMYQNKHKQNVSMSLKWDYRM